MEDALNVLVAIAAIYFAYRWLSRGTLDYMVDFSLWLIREKMLARLVLRGTLGRLLCLDLPQRTSHPRW
jgi:hypothetical protein